MHQKHQIFVPVHIVFFPPKISKKKKWIYILTSVSETRQKEKSPANKSQEMFPETPLWQIDCTVWAVIHFRFRFIGHFFVKPTVDPTSCSKQSHFRIQRIKYTIKYLPKILPLSFLRPQVHKWVNEGAHPAVQLQVPWVLECKNHPLNPGQRPLVVGRSQQFVDFFDYDLIPHHHPHRTPHTTTGGELRYYICVNVQVATPADCWRQSHIAHLLVLVWFRVEKNSDRVTTILQ